MINPFFMQQVALLQGRIGEASTGIWPFIYTLEFEIAQGETASDSVSVTGGNDFLCASIGISARYAASTAPAGAVSQAKIPRNVRDELASQTAANLSMIELKITQQERPWMQTFVRADLVTGDLNMPALLPAAAYLPAGSTATIECRNNLPSSVGGVAPTIEVQIALYGIAGKREVIEAAQAILRRA